MLHLQLAALALTASALIASGCGGSSKTTTTTAATTATATTTAATTPSTTTATVKIATGTPLPRAKWIAEGDAICERAKAKTSAQKVQAISDFARVYPLVALYNKTEATELAKLVPPTAMSHDWAQIINALELHARYVSEVARYVGEGNEKSAGQPYHLSTVVLEQMLKTAKRDGFKQCSIAR
jgi:hypothetical protein